MRRRLRQPGQENITTWISICTIPSLPSLEVSGAVKRTAVKVIDDVGLLAIQDKCVNHIADLFVQQSRFDPLHHAATEQALLQPYDAMPARTGK